MKTGLQRCIAGGGGAPVVPCRNPLRIWLEMSAMLPGECGRNTVEFLQPGAPRSSAPCRVDSAPPPFAHTSQLFRSTSLPRTLRFLHSHPSTAGDDMMAAACITRSRETPVGAADVPQHVKVLRDHHLRKAQPSGCDLSFAVSGPDSQHTGAALGLF